MGMAWSVHKHPKADELKTQMVPSSETQVSKAWDLSSNQTLVCFGGMLGCSASICPKSVGPYVVWQGRICLEFGWREKEVQIAVSSEPVIWAGGASAWAVTSSDLVVEAEQKEESWQGRLPPRALNYSSIY